MSTKKVKCQNCKNDVEISNDKEESICPYCNSKLTNINNLEKENENLRNEEEKERFKKSKFSKVLLIAFAIAGIGLFTDNNILQKVLLLIQACLFMSSWLMGMKIIKEYKKDLHTILAIIGFVLIIPIIGLNSIGSMHELEISKKIDNNSIIMNKTLPDLNELNTLKGKIIDNTSTNLSIEYKSVPKDKYYKYIKSAKDKGYTIDQEETDTNFTGYNNEGYKLTISYSSYFNNRMEVILRAPENLKTIEWPSLGLASKIPKPISNQGKIYTDDSKTFRAIIGNTSIDDYNKYIKECEKSGFTENYSKSEKQYSAENKEKIKISINYIGANVIEISIYKDDTVKDTKKEEIKKENKTEVKKEEPKKEEKQTQAPKVKSSDFKKYMDSYESFMNKYVEFIKKYNKNPSDLTLLAKYADMINEYSKQLDEFDKYDDTHDLTSEELSYYLEVQSRVLKKLSEIQ